MAKNKLKKFAELNKFDRVFQPAFDEVYKKDYALKGHWAEEVFGNDHPIILELGCGKGEYTLGLAKKFPCKNVIGVDIKGARIWKGARQVYEEQILNSAFLRTRIELIDSFFARDEVQEIWLTFPDPQEKKRRMKKRLSGPRFLTLYQHFLVNMGIVHLKTDSDKLFEYTLNMARFNDLNILYHTTDLYRRKPEDEILEIRTFYEKMFLEEGKTINYLKFRLPQKQPIKELPDEGR